MLPGARLAIISGLTWVRSPSEVSERYKLKPRLSISVAVTQFSMTDVFVPVAVNDANSTAVGAFITAAPAFTIPLPHIDVVQVLPAGKLVILFCKISSTWSGVNEGLSE